MGVHQKAVQIDAEMAAVADFVLPPHARPDIANDATPHVLPRDLTTAWALSIAEALAIIAVAMACGAAHASIHTGHPPLGHACLGVGLLVATLFVGGRRMIEPASDIPLETDLPDLRRPGLAWCATFALLALVTLLIHPGAAIHRDAVLGFFVTGFVAAELAHAATARALARWYLPNSLGGNHLLLAGAAGETDLDWLQAEFVRAGADNVSVVAFDAHCAESSWPLELGRFLLRARDCARISGHGRVCVAGAGIPPARLRQLLTELQCLPRAVELVPSFFVERLLHLPRRSFGHVSAIEIQRMPLNRLQRAGKRVLDLAVAIPLVALLAPVLAAVALAIRLDSQGPILFRQQRLGFRGRPFAILKFRTMTVQENGTEVRQAQKNDARVTPVGRLLRAWSLDELPQLFNVIKGEMSLVGPRPHARAHDEHYAELIDDYELRQHVKPGITGWAQVNGRRGETPTVESMRDRVEYDVWYARHNGLVLDVEILLRTAIEVFRRRNAY